MRTIKIIIWIALFAIAMGFMESAVVIYLRELYYKTGFDFPLKSISPFIAKVEFFREIATIIILSAVGVIAGKNNLQRFAYFILAFAIWDIFYYVFLYVCLGWPQSLSTWDILFLIPIPWVGPVWAPCLLSLVMIIGSLYVIFQIEKKPDFKIDRHLWWFVISGAVICIFSFMWDYLVFTYDSEHKWSVLSTKNLFIELETYVPTEFNSPLFFLGFFLMISPLVFSIYRSLKTNK